jgi:protease I
MPSIVLFLAGPDYEDLELHYPKLRLEEAGWDVKIAGLGEDRYYGKHGYPCDVDGPVGDFPASELAGVVVPGGWAPDRLRRAPEVLALVRALHARKKLVGSICHGPSVLISAGIVRGRRMTSSAGIRDDLVNAGADWVQAPVVVDENLVSAQVPKDLPAFGLALVNFLDTWRAS